MKIFDNNQLELTTIEFEILSILIKHKNQTISRQDLASSLSKISRERSLKKFKIFKNRVWGRV